MPRHELQAHGKTWLLDVPERCWLEANIAETGRPYEWQMLEHIAAERPSGRVVDVGAHIGNHALYFAIALGLEVIAFEPIFWRELEANLRLNHVPTHRMPEAHVEGSVRSENTALGDRRTQAADSGARVDRSTPGRGEGALDVGAGPIEVLSLDSFELTDVALIKVDVEGMEEAVLRGGVQTLRRCRPLVYLEAETQTAHDAHAAVLEPLGYEMFRRFRDLTPREAWRCG